jgi:hypothetical protein
MCASLTVIVGLMISPLDSRTGSSMSIFNKQDQDWLEMACILALLFLSS